MALSLADLTLGKERRQNNYSGNRAVGRSEEHLPPGDVLLKEVCNDVSTPLLRPDSAEPTPR